MIKAIGDIKPRGEILHYS